MTGLNPTTPRIRAAWLFLLLLACVEVVGSLVVRARVPEASDWDRAAARVAAEWRDGDLVTAAPTWGDPLVREAMGRALGERFDLRLAGAPGVDGAQRLWVMSIRGHDTHLLPEGTTAELTEQIGRVRLERFALPPSIVRFDFVAALDGATVTRGGRDCHRSGGRASGGGLGAGPALGERFGCAGESVGATVIEDLAFAGRYCILQRPSHGEPVAVTFPAVPMGETLVLFAGLHWVDERHHTEAEHVDAPVTLTVRDAERELGTFVHHDGDGWSRAALEVPEDLRGTTRALTFTVTSDRTHDRSFCWTGLSLDREASAP